MSKKLLSFAVCIIMIVALLAACGGNTPAPSDTGTPAPAPEPSTSAPAASGGVIDLSFFHWKGEEQTTWDKIIEMFEAENEGIKVQMEILPEDQYYTSLQARVMGGEGLDVFMVNPGSRFKNFLKADAFMDLTGQPFLDEIAPVFLTAGQANGAQYIVPLSKSFVGYFYNKTVFNDLGLSVPTTWDEFLDVSAAIKASGMEVISTGMADAWTNTLPWIENLVQYTSDLDVYPKLVSGEYKLTDDIFVKTLTPLKEMYDKGIWMKDASGTKYDTSITLFATEQAAMFQNGTWATGAIRDTNPDLDFSIFIMPNPGANIVAGMQPDQAPCVFSKTKNAEASMLFMNFIFSKDIMEFYANSTGQSSPNVNAVVDDPLIQEFSQIGNSGQIYPHNYSLWPQLDQDLVAEMTYRAMSGEDVNTILADAQQKLEALGLKLEE